MMKEKTIIKITLTVILAICFAMICLVNFSAVPSFFDADMYCDYKYAIQVWDHKSIFPVGWVFGNQLNAVSTPVLTGILYGLSGIAYINLLCYKDSVWFLTYYSFTVYVDSVIWSYINLMLHRLFLSASDTICNHRSKP